MYSFCCLDSTDPSPSCNHLDSGNKVQKFLGLLEGPYIPATAINVKTHFLMLFECQ